MLELKLGKTAELLYEAKALIAGMLATKGLRLNRRLKLRLREAKELMKEAGTLILTMRTTDDLSLGRLLKLRGKLRVAVDLLNEAMLIADKYNHTSDVKMVVSDALQKAEEAWKLAEEIVMEEEVGDGGG
jgi:hypothetical protein